MVNKRYEEKITEAKQRIFGAQMEMFDVYATTLEDVYRGLSNLNERETFLGKLEQFLEPYVISHNQRSLEDTSAQPTEYYQRGEEIDYIAPETAKKIRARLGTSQINLAKRILGYSAPDGKIKTLKTKISSVESKGINSASKTRKPYSKETIAYVNFLKEQEREGNETK
jgi:hypothetical protein